ncbi:MAG: hypothetical protein GC162_07655 [Planctomycetes bacterium]|nr:hypothetical protein [Planctomycetota bacterium]
MNGTHRIKRGAGQQSKTTFRGGLAAGAVMLAIGSPFAGAATLNVTDGLVAWYDGALSTYSNTAGTSASTIGGNVLRWEDQAPLAGNNHVQQQNVVSDPTLANAGLADGLNGTHTVLHFSGTNNLLALDGGSGLPNQDPFGDSLDGSNITWFVVSRSNSAATTQRTLGAQVGTTASQWGSFYETDGDQTGSARNGSGTLLTSRADTSPASTGIVRTEFTIQSTAWNGAASIQSFVTDNAGHFVQGPKTAGGADVGDFNRFRIGMDSAGTTGLTGDIAEVLIYNQTLVGRDRAKVEQYLYDKYFRTAPDDVVAYYELGEKAPGNTGSIGQTIIDETGNHNGAVAGNVVDYISGDAGHQINGRGIHFDGSDEANRDRITIADDAAFHFDGSFTIESLVRTTDTGVVSVVAKNGVSGSVSQWWMRSNTGRLEFLIRDEGGHQYSVTSAVDQLINTGDWVQVAGVYDAAAAQLKL